MKYNVVISEYAFKQLKKLDKQVIPRIKKELLSLSDNPRPNGYIKLKGQETYRIRIGDYRVIYEIIDNQLIVIVLEIDHRKQIYR